MMVRRGHADHPCVHAMMVRRGHAEHPCVHAMMVRRGHAEHPCVHAMMVRRGHAEHPCVHAMHGLTTASPRPHTQHNRLPSQPRALAITSSPCHHIKPNLQS
eukprot:365476-Chlamydomonas_euryale.AAC.2